MIFKKLFLGVLLLAACAVVPLPACLNQLYGEEGGGSPIVSSDMQPSGKAASDGGSSTGMGSSSSSSNNRAVSSDSRSAKTSGNSGMGNTQEHTAKITVGGKSRRVCYPDGVCFTTDQPPYNGLPLPIPPVGMPLRYYLYTPESSVVEDLPVTAESVNFLDDRPLKLFIHGFGMNAAHYLVIEFARKMVYKCECNVIIVDWRGGSYGGYTSLVTGDNFKRRTALAFSNSRVAARILGKFLHRLYEKRQTILPQTGLHCIGVDIGAHICAQLQESFHEPLARISGLNPTVPKGCGNACLDQTDATQVDVIHTTRGGNVGSERTSVVDLGDLGADESVGHLDFFVNWDEHSQPNCGSKDADLPQRCSSSRALELFTQSIGESCLYVARSCAKAPASKCTPCTASFHQCVRMGWFANKSLLIEPTVNKFAGKFFIDTDEASPYCGVDD